MVLALTRERLETPPAPKRRSKPPSRRRFEASHPSVSARVDLDLYAQLKKLKEKHNMTILDVLKVGLERCEQLELIKVLKTRISQEENTSP
jgi:hypothetical protein